MDPNWRQLEQVFMITHDNKHTLPLGIAKYATVFQAELYAILCFTVMQLY